MQVMTPIAGSVATLAISPAGSGRTVKHMDRELFERELNYRVAMSIAKSMRSEGLIPEDEYKAIDTIMRDKYRPILSGLCPDNRLIQ